MGWSTSKEARWRDASLGVERPVYKVIQLGLDFSAAAKHQFTRDAGLYSSLWSGSLTLGAKRDYFRDNQALI